MKQRRKKRPRAKSTPALGKRDRGREGGKIGGAGRNRVTRLKPCAGLELSRRAPGVCWGMEGTRSSRVRKRRADEAAVDLLRNRASHVYVALDSTALLQRIFISHRRRERRSIIRRCPIWKKSWWARKWRVLTDGIPGGRILGTIMMPFGESGGGGAGEARWKFDERISDGGIPAGPLIDCDIVSLPPTFFFKLEYLICR